MSRSNWVDQLRSVLVSLGLAFGAFLVGNLLVLVTGIVLAALGIPVFDRPALSLLIGSVVLQGVTFGGLALVYLRYRDLDWDFIRVHSPTKRDVGVVVVGFVTLLAMLLVSAFVLTSLGIDSAQNRVLEIGQQNPAVLLLLVPLSFLLIGPGEELMFRGLIQGTLREAFHPIRAVVLASAIFAAVHIFSLTGDGKLAYIGVVFVLALVLGGTYELTDNLAVPSLIHGAYNALQFGGAYLAAVGLL